MSPLEYPTIEGKVIGATSPNSPDIIQLSSYTNVDVMVTAITKLSSVKLRYSASGGYSGEINLQRTSSSWWEEDWRGTIPKLSKGVLYKFEWIGDGNTYITNYIIFGKVDGSLKSITINGKTIADGETLKDVNTLKIEATVDGVVRYVKAEIYKSVDGRWSSYTTVVFDNLGGGKYSKTISLGEGTYKILIRLDYGSRTASSTEFIFYVKNSMDLSWLQYIGFGLVGVGGYMVYRYREED
jgi:hypothetical protein